MKRHVLLFLFVLCAAMELASGPASACFNWCAWWTWGRRPPAINSVDPTPLLDRVAPQDSVIELQISRHRYVPPVIHDNSDPVVEPYGLRESEVRNAFDIAYGNSAYPTLAARERAYAEWKATIGEATTTGTHIKYRFTSPAGDMIKVKIDRRTGTLLADMQVRTSGTVNSNTDRVLQLYSRAFVATGGRTPVRSIARQWRRGTPEGNVFESLLSTGFDALDIADGTGAGLIANRYYNMSASQYQLKENVHKVKFRESTTPDGSIE